MIQNIVIIQLTGDQMNVDKFLYDLFAVLFIKNSKRMIRNKRLEIS